MSWKLNVVTAVLSVIILNPLEAAKDMERTLKSPQTVKDTSTMLQDMHSQMKMMQEQLGGLKASQQLLSAEMAIKNLTPKVRKLEIHLERLEKQFASGASSDELNSLKNDFLDMKEKMQGLMTAPDTSVEAALSALNPTLERMQKQVYYLYEAVKKQADRHEKELNEKMNLVAQKMAELEKDIQIKLFDMQGAASSLSLIRQALQHNYSLITTLKVDIESIKNEKIGQLFQDIHNIKQEFSKDELLAKLTMLKSHIAKLATVFKQSLSSIQTTTQMAEKSMALANGCDIKVKELTTAQGKQLQGLKVLFQKNQALVQQLGIVKAVVEQAEQGLTQKVKAEVDGYKLGAIQKGLVVLKKNQDKLLNDLDLLRKNNETLTLEQQAKVDDIKTSVKAVVEQAEQGLTQKIKAEVDGYKLGSIQKGLVVLKKNQDKLLNDLDLLRKNNETLTLEQQANFDDIKTRASQIQEIDGKLGILDKKSTALFYHVKNLASRDEIDKLAQGLGLSLDKIDSLYRDMKQVHEEVSQTLSKNQQMEQQISKVNKSYMHFEEMKQKLEKLSMQCVYLHKQIKAHVPSVELQKFKDQIAELSLKVNNLLGSKPQGLVENVSSQVQEKIESMQAEIKGLYQKLEEKETQLAKLTKRVAVLTKTLSEKLDQSPQENGDLTQLKSSLEEKLEQEIKAVKSDRMLFETLIQRVAALEASINIDVMDKNQLSESLDP